MEDQGFEAVQVPLGDRAYDILIGAGLLDRAGALVAPFLRGKHIAVVTDETVAALHLPRLEAALANTGAEVSSLRLPPGEASKSWAGIERTVEWLIGRRIGRDDLVLAFGGGVIGDLAGFAAAVLRRGVRFVQVPTTLLAQVDSSVGGKTGINSPLGKNLIGAFHQPALVIADTGLLNTLPVRQQNAGYAEVLKYGLLGDAAFFGWLEANGAAVIRGDSTARAVAVRRSCEMKSQIVAEDETEQGDRALLNLGHTFGHAFEAATSYSDRLLHGEAVAIGCGLAFDLSAALGLCSPEEGRRVRRHLESLGSKARVSDIPGDLPDADELLSLMQQDKKVRDGRLSFVLARGIGQALLLRDVDPAPVRAVLSHALNARKTGR